MNPLPEPSLLESLPLPRQGMNDASDIGVCLATRRFYPLYGGATERFRRYAPGLAKRGTRVQVFTSIRGKASEGRGGPDNSRARADETEDMLPSDLVDGVPVRRVDLPRNWRRHPLYYARLFEYCKSRRNQIDVVHFLNLHKWGAPWVYGLRRSAIATVISCTMLTEISTVPWKRAKERFVERLPFNLVDMVVASSVEMRQYLEDLGVRKPVTVIPNGVDLQRFRPATDESEKIRLRRKLGLPLSGQLILSVGAVQPRKGTDVLLEAFARLCGRGDEDPHLVVAGPRHDLTRPSLTPFAQRIQACIAKGQISSRVTFAGEVKGIEDYYRAADIFVFPSRLEGMPNAVLEAMACGLPVVMTPFKGLSEDLGADRIHFVISGWESERLATDIRNLLTQPPARRELGRAALRWIRENHDVNRSLDQYADLYRELTDRYENRAAAHVPDVQH